MVKHEDEDDNETACARCCCNCIVKCPCLFAILALLCCLLLSGGAWIDIAFEGTSAHGIETDVSAYIRVAHQQTDVNDAVSAAFVREKEINAPATKRRLLQTSDSSIDMALLPEAESNPIFSPPERRGLAGQTERSKSSFSINFFYFVINTDDHGHNVFTKEHLDEIRKYENDFRESTGFKEKCWVIFSENCCYWPINPPYSSSYRPCTHKKMSHAIETQAVKDKPDLCEPGDTITNYMYPSVKGIDYTFDGKGKMVNDIDDALVLMYQQNLIFYMDRYFSATNLTSSVTRATFWFGLPLKGYTSADDRYKEQEAKVHEWLENLHKKFLKKRQFQSDHVRVMWQNNYLQKYEILLALQEDAYLASGSLLFVYFYMAFYLCSFSLSAAAMIGILLSFPTSYFFYHTVFANPSMSILNFVALFLILGIGADDCFVYVDSWRHSKLLEKKNVDAATNLRRRMVWTFKVAGKSMLVTTLTTACSFLANLVSPIQAVADFGLFMGLTVIINYVIVMTWFPCCVLAIELCPCCNSCCKCNCEPNERSGADGDGPLEWSQAQLEEDNADLGSPAAMGSPPAPNNARKSVKIVRKVTSVFQSMRENVFGAASHADLHATLASSEQQPANDNLAKQNSQNRRKSRALGNVLMALDDLQGDDASPGAEGDFSKSTAEMIQAEKDQVDMKLRKEDGHKPMEIAIHNYFSSILYWKRGGAFIFIGLTIACLGVSGWRFVEDFTVADRPPQFFDLRHNLGGLEDVTSNYFSEAANAMKDSQFLPTRTSTSFDCLTDTDCGDHGRCETASKKHSCVCDKGKKGAKCDQDVRKVQLTLDKKAIKASFSPSLQEVQTNICVGNAGEQESMDFKLDSSATKPNSMWTVSIEPSDSDKRTIDPGRACETFAVKITNKNTDAEWADDTVIRFLWKPSSVQDFSQTDVKVSGEYVRKPGITDLLLYCDTSQRIAFTTTFQRSTTAYDAKVPSACASKLSFVVTSQFSDTSLLSMKFGDQNLVQTSGSRFAVKGLTPGGKGVAQLFVAEDGKKVLKYSVTLETLKASTDASFKEVQLFEDQNSSPKVVSKTNSEPTVTLQAAAKGVGIRVVPTSSTATWAVTTNAQVAPQGLCPEGIKCYQLSAGSTKFNVVVTAEDGKTTQNQKFIVSLKEVACVPSGATPAVTGGTVNCAGVTQVGKTCQITPDKNYNCDKAAVKCKAQATSGVYEREGECSTACDGKKVTFTGGEADCSSALKTGDTCKITALSGRSCESVKVKCSAEGKYDVTGTCTSSCTGSYTDTFPGATLDCSAANDPGEACALFALSGWDCTDVTVKCHLDGQDVSYKKGDQNCQRITTTTAPEVCTKYDDFSSASSGTFDTQMTCDDILLRNNAKYTTCDEVKVMLSAGKDCRGCKCGCNEVAPTVNGATVNCAKKTKIGDLCQVTPQSPFTCRDVKVKCVGTSKGFAYVTEGTCISPSPGKCQCTMGGKAYTCDQALQLKNANLPKTCEALDGLNNPLLGGSCDCNKGIQGCSCGCGNLPTPKFVGGTADCTQAVNMGAECDVKADANYKCDKKIICDGNTNQGFFFTQSGSCRSTLTTTTTTTVTTTKESLQVHVNFDLDYNKYIAEGGTKEAWSDYVKKTIADKLGIRPEDVKLVSAYENNGRRRLGRRLGTAFVIEIELPSGKDKSDVVKDVRDSFDDPKKSPGGNTQVGAVSDAEYICSAKWVSEQKNLPDGVASVSCDDKGACTVTQDQKSDHDCAGVTGTCFNNNCIPVGPNVCGLKFKKACIPPCDGKEIIISGGRIDCSAAKKNLAKCKPAQPIGSYNCDSEVTATCTAGKYTVSDKKCQPIVTCNGLPVSYKDFTADCSKARNINDKCLIKPKQTGTCDNAEVTCVKEGNAGVYKANYATGACPLQCDPSKYSNTITGANVDCAGKKSLNSECTVTAKTGYTCKKVDGSQVTVTCSKQGEEAKYAVDGSCYLSTTWKVTGSGCVPDSDPTCVVSRNYKPADANAKYQNGDQCVLEAQVDGSVSDKEAGSLGTGDSIKLNDGAKFQFNSPNIVKKGDKVTFSANSDNSGGRWRLCLSLPSCSPDAKPQVPGATSVDCTNEAARYDGGKCTLGADGKGFDCKAVTVTCDGTKDVHVVAGKCNQICGRGSLDSGNGNYDCSMATPSKPGCTVTKADADFDCTSVDVKCLTAGRTETGKCVKACSGNYAAALTSEFPAANPKGGGTADCSDAKAAGNTCKITAVAGHSCEGTTVSCYADGNYKKLNAGGADCFVDSCPSYVAKVFLETISVRETSANSKQQTLSPAFSKGTSRQTFSVGPLPFTTKQVHVQGTFSSAGAFRKCKFSVATAKGQVSLVADTNNQALVPIGDGQTAIKVIAVGSSPSDNREYTINVVRGPAKVDAKLKSLGIDASFDKSLDPAWSADVFEYDLILPAEPGWISITPEANDAAAKVNTDGQGDGAVIFSMEENLGPKTVKIVVTAEDGKTQQVYTIDLFRKPKKCPKNEGKECNNQGVCQGLDGECMCNKNYGGSSCEAHCPNDCSGHGACGREECTADIAKENIPATFKAELASKYNIPGSMVSCSAVSSTDLCCEVLNGELVKDLCCATCASKNCSVIAMSTEATGSDCICENGFTSADCSVKECPKYLGKTCNEHGECQKDYTCKCETGYSGASCSRLVCEMGAPEGSDKKKECFGGGNCVAGKCECFQGYSGAACADKEESAFKLPWAKCAEINVMWGLDASSDSKSVFGRSASKAIDRSNFPTQLYPNGRPVFDPSFDPRKTEVQQYLADVCRKFVNGPGLEWRGTGERRTASGKKEAINWCFMDYFKRYVISKGKKFPVPFSEFDALVHEMVSQHDNNWAHMFFATVIGRPEGYPNNKNNRSLFFIAGKYKINIRPRDAALKTEPIFKAWDAFAKKINADAPAGSGTMVHSSTAWLLLLVETEAVVGSIQAMGISVGAAFIAVFLFTGNFLVSLYTALSIVVIVIFLGTFIVAALKWPFGAIESVCLTIFVGFSVDYVLHIAHKYNEAHEYHSSFLKMRIAITSIGPSIISASITTAGSAIFLVFCQIYIFQQMGWLLIANTVLAILVAMLTFTSILSVCGPRGRCCDMYVYCEKRKKKKQNDIEMVRRVQSYVVPPESPGTMSVQNLENEQIP